MSRTHRRPRSASQGNPARALGVDLKAAARKGILTTAALGEGGAPQFTARAAARAETQDRPGTRKAAQKGVNRRDRAAARAVLNTAPYRCDPARRTALRLERAVIAVTGRTVDWDLS